MATYVNDLRLKEIGTGESSGTWGTETNVNLELIGEALGYGTEGITTNADTHTTTVADGSTDPGRAMYIEYTGTLDSACTITIAPNTLSRLHYIENGTSGSQNIIIKQGSGATVTIPPGDTKAVYLDGAGSGAKVVDVFASFSVVDLKVQDDLTVTDDATIGGTLGVTGILTCTDDIIIGDGKTIGSASDVDSMTIAANGQVTFTQTLIGTALDISGDIDVDGTANLDIVDIDGAVDMATTLAVAGNVDFNGDLDVDGTTNLDIVDIDGAVDMASTLAVGGVLTANAGVVVDNITIDGTQIDLSSGDLTLDVAGKILLSADDAGTIQLFDGSLHYGSISEDNSNFLIQSIVQDEDILFKGDDGGSVITALTLDMSEAGSASFNHDIQMVDNGLLRMGAGGDLILTSDGTNGTIFANEGNLILDTAGDIHLDAGGGDVVLLDDGTHLGTIKLSSTFLTFDSQVSNQDMKFTGNDGGVAVTALTFDMSDAAAATFGDPTYGSGLGQVRIINNASSVAPASLSLFGFGNVGDDAEYAKIDAAMQLSGTAGQVAASISFKAVGTGENKSVIDFLTHDGTSLNKTVRIDEVGQVGIGGSGGEIQADGYQLSLYGNVVAAWFENRSSTSAHEVMIINRQESDGVMIAFLQASAEKGTISQSGGTISYNAFMGSHYSESSEDLSNTLLGTVVETVDALVENKYEDQARLPKCKVSNTSESPNVYGVWIEDNGTGQVAALGASWCRINGSVTASMGDLLVSNGDGTAKVQADDIIRSKTIGKVTSTVKKVTYEDGSYVVPVVLYCG